MNDAIGIGDLVAVVTAGGLAIYVMGLVGLSITIRRTFTGDISTAWYAVSLLPRVVVAGQGVRIWLGWPIFSTAIFLPGPLIVGALPGGKNEIGLWEWVSTLMIPLIIGAVALLRRRREVRPNSKAGLITFAGVTFGLN
jgi:hypothetical protein